MDVLNHKEQSLRARLRALGRVAVAFSGGTDSSLLLAVAREELGDDVVAFTALSPAFPHRERETAERFCRERGIRQITFPAPLWDSPELLSNQRERCYRCKRAFLERVWELARQEGCTALAEGSNVDDLGDFRPGMKAVEELGVLSPLREAGLTKAEVRALSRDMGLPGWNQPSAACLASRIPWGEPITAEKLALVEQAEDYLHSLGFGQLRVRLHGTLARVELPPEDFSRLLERREAVYERLRSLGCSFVSLDLLGYRTGSLNEGAAGGMQ